MKIKTIVSIIIVFVLLITSMPAFADVAIPAIPMDAWDYWVVVETRPGGKTQFELLTSHYPITAYSNGNALHMDTCRSYVFDGSDWIYDFEALSGVTVPIVKVYAASHNIAYYNGSGFFFTVHKASSLYLTMKRVDSGMILRTILAGLIPLLGCVILVICFRKGWDFLHSLLMR